MKIKDIGRIPYTVLLFGGVYSNLEAITKMRRIALDKGIPPDRVICTGDVVAYCANPEESVQEVIDWGVHCIAGNVEIQLREGKDDCGCDFEVNTRCDMFSKDWYPYAKEKMSETSLEWMQSLPEFIQFEYYGKKCTVVHGSYHHTSEYIFKSTPWEVKAKNFQDTQSDIIIAGHCGLPFHEVNGNQWWLNPGVIGMPANDGTPRVWYMTLTFENEKIHFQHHSFEYNNEATSTRMVEAKLPMAYAQTLTTGLWDNNDILPEEETSLQGIPIIL